MTQPIVHNLFSMTMTHLKTLLSNTKHFVMKGFSLFILITLACSALPAQAPFYLIFNKSCMDQLEYKYTYYGNSMLAYSVRPNATEQFILSTANEGITSPNIPKGAVSCRDMNLNQDFIESINSHKRNVYIVNQRPQGDYMLTPIIAATYVVRNGAFYMVRGLNYAFALDTTRLVNETNLATGNSSSYVYFTGMKFRDCLMEYSFRREPAKTNMERSDFEFIPSLGLTSERTGINAADAETNHMRLVKVNGQVLDDYIAISCGGKSSQAGSTISPWTPPVDYGKPVAVPIGPPTYAEMNKEDASMQNKVYNQVYTQNPATGLINCTEAPGEGYHIVQPGDNIKAIARTYGVTEANLVGWNKIKNPNKIEICQKIWLRKPPLGNTMLSKGDATARVQAPVDGSAKKVMNQSAYWDNREQQSKSPAQYSTPGQPQNYAPAQYSTTVTPSPKAAQTQIHRVKSGDYLYKLAKQYGCVEECIRRANNMPLEGDVPLWPGQELIIPECTCTVNKQKGVQQQPVQSSILTTPAQYNTPVQYNTPAYTNPKPAYQNTFIERPVNDNQPSAQRYDYTQPPQPQAVNPADDKSDTYFTEHIVQQGETVNSIAYKYRVSASELAQVNGINATESLMPGKRLLIPHKG